MLVTGLLTVLLLFTGMSIADLFQDAKKEFQRKAKITSRSTKPRWPVECIYTSMINQDHKWFMYRPILECCYKCRKPYHECLKKIHPWFCYREAFACSTKCIAKSYWHDKRIAENTAQILRNYPMDSYSKESSETVSSGDYQSSPASHPKLPCVGHMCNGKLCFRAQLCYEVEERYLKNIPPVLT